MARLMGWQIMGTGHLGVPDPKDQLKIPETSPREMFDEGWHCAVNDLLIDTVRAFAATRGGAQAILDHLDVFRELAEETLARGV